MSEIQLCFANIESRVRFSRSMMHGIFTLSVFLFVAAFPSVSSSLADETPSSVATKTPTMPPLSDAERIAELQETLDDQQKQLTALQNDLDDPRSEYALAEEAFRSLDRELQEKQETLEKVRAQGNAKLVNSLEKELVSLEKQRTLAKDRFDLAIEERKTVREEIATLRHKLQSDKEALDDLTGAKEPEEADAMKNDGETHQDRRDRSANRDSSSDDNSSSMENGSQDKSLDHNDSSETDDKPNDAEVAQAVEEAQQKEQAADEAQDETRSLAARIADLQKLIAQQQKVLTLTRKKADLAKATQQTLASELAKRQAEQADEAELQELRQGAVDAQQRNAESLGELAALTDQLNDSRSELAALQSEQIVALQEAEQARQLAEAAKDHVESLRNPFAPRNLLQWAIDHGPKLAIILLSMFLLNRVASFFSHRSVRLVASGQGRGSTVERENRARTLVGVFQNAVTVAIFITGILMMLEEIGVNITVLMGGVAVVGLAVAFGAQNLIKDYFYGFVMLLENQYMLNDQIRVGSVSGQVERITLRMTVLRDANGVVHFIPNGTIESISNETHGWSRAVFDIAVGYQEDLDRVIDALEQLTANLRVDPQFQSLILDNATTPSIESFGESAVQLRFSIKTRPNKQGEVKRELMHRIKRRFDELKIEPPYPQRTIVQRPISDAKTDLGQSRHAA